MSKGNEGVLHIPLIFRIGALPSDTDYCHVQVTLLFLLEGTVLLYCWEIVRIFICLKITAFDRIMYQKTLKKKHKYECSMNAIL